MSNMSKRYRQISIFESFESLNKKSKNTTMEENDSSWELTAANAEEIVSSSKNICGAANDSMKIMDKNSETNVEAEASSAENEKKSDTDDNYKHSSDLFPGGSSLEDYSIPSSSHSEELFPDSEPQSTPEDCNESTPEVDEPDHLLLLNRSPDCLIPLPKLEPLENHSIMFSPHVRPGDAPRPYPSSYRDKWGSDHVRMPCSPQSKYPVETATGEKQIVSRWDLICQSLMSDIDSSKKLEEAIMSYNTQYIGKWNFQGLHTFINKHWREEERDHFFEVILPKMIEMALSLPYICTQPVPLLKRGKDHYLTMSQKQIGCLLLNAFFCTFPRRTVPIRHKRERWNYEYASYPDINFNRLFYGVKNTLASRSAEKFKCLFNYFRRIVTEEPTGTVTFHRQTVKVNILPLWHTSTRGFRTAIIKSQGLIETDGQGMLQVDFANKFVGGGVLGFGCVQEEIRFIVCPELIVSRLFVEYLENNEVLIVTGVEQYNKQSGYADSFKWEGDFRDSTPRDPWGRRYTQLVAMDAICFRNSAEQFKFQFIKRELNKAFCAFYEEGTPPVHLPAVATGNWGCGAFKGNPNLKFLIQLMAASEAGRSLLYFTFGNKKLKRELQKMYDFLSDKNLSVGDVWNLLINYGENLSSYAKSKYSGLYDYIYSQFTNKEDSKKQDSISDDDIFLSESGKRAADKLFEDVAQAGSSMEIEDGT